MDWRAVKQAWIDRAHAIYEDTGWVSYNMVDNTVGPCPLCGRLFSMHYLMADGQLRPCGFLVPDPEAPTEELTAAIAIWKLTGDWEPVVTARHNSGRRYTFTFTPTERSTTP